MTSTRIDVVSIFPDYLAPLGLSLLGRAQSDGLLSVHVHDLRDFTHDRHRTTDDTPYGGGAGMVMRPEPWGEALDAVLESGSDSRVAVRPTLVVPTPSGELFSQSRAAELARCRWLVVACGRYEGIDERVIDAFSERMDVLELSIGDYVVNGGEAAALVVVEAVARLLPGFMRNPESLTEESHGLGGAAHLLEYPVYTKPPRWRGLAVPDVLLSGHHGDIAAWRRREAVRRTARRRPDLVPSSSTLAIDGPAGSAVPTALGSVEVRLARPADAAELWVLQRCCWVGEAQLNDALFLPALTESLDDVLVSLTQWQTFVVRAGGRLIGSVRGRLMAAGDGGAPRWDIGRLMVAPDLTGRGLGRWLLAYVEKAAPAEAATYQLVTGWRSAQNLRRYRKAGYRERRPVRPDEGIVTLVKPVPRPAQAGD